MLWEIPLLSLSSGLSWASSCFSSAGACLHHRDAPPLLPSDTTQGYRTVKAKLGSKKVRPWKWMPFTNPARKDGAMFYHWRRAAEEGKDYPFARFNKVSEVNFKQKRINSSCKLSFHQPFEYPVRKLVLSMCEGWNRFDSYILNCISWKLHASQDRMHCMNKCEHNHPESKLCKSPLAQGHNPKQAKYGMQQYSLCKSKSRCYSQPQIEEH